MNVLIVDRHQWANELVTMIDFFCKQQGGSCNFHFQVHTGQDQAAILAAYNNFKPNVVLVDLMLQPGYRITSELIEAHPTARIIGTTIERTNLVIYKLKKSKAVGLIPKTATPQEFADLMQHVASGQEYWPDPVE
jgi:DNA-binding NarL/FixJ family response regulator